MVAANQAVAGPDYPSYLTDDWDRGYRSTRIRNRIEADPRHDSLEVLETGLVDGRVFGRWSMAKVADQSDEPDLPLIAHVTGIAAAAPRGDGTADQEAVLEVMREAARGRQPV